tara:strand:+ start:1440 stop:4343 length:2904 start_codon:yes stop_codon:yes gene_type:complete
MRKQGKGKISQKININSNFITPINISTPIQGNIDMNYFASSSESFINAGGDIFFVLNLSNVENIFNYKQPQLAGNTIFNDIQTTPTVILNYKGDKSEEDVTIKINSVNDMSYVDNGRNYVVSGVKNESNNFINEPSNISLINSNVTRSDIDGFDLPEFRISNSRKVPHTGDTLCGPINYSGYTYNRSNFNWKFGNGVGIDFNPIKSGGTPTINTGMTISQEGCSTISNEDGQLLFYCDGERVFTSGNTIMLNGDNLSSSGTSTQSSLIIPRLNTNQYYIFTTDYNGNPNGFEYSVVDMSLGDNSEGAVTSKNIKLINDAVSEKVTSCETKDGNGYWVITHTSGDSKYYSYKLTSSGLSGPIISNTGTTHSTARGYMKTSTDGSKIVSLLYDQGIIDVGDFNNDNGEITNIKTISGITYDNGPYGLEFSSDSSKFYVSDGGSDNIIQFNLDFNNEIEIKEKRIKFNVISGSSIGALQMGVDERIYISDINKPYLHTINNPNGLGVQCNLQINSFPLTSTTITATTSTWGLPNFITTNNLSCDRFVYISKIGRDNFEFDLIINNLNNVIKNKNLSFTGEIYKFNKQINEFTNSSVYKFNISDEKLSNTNKVSIPLVNIGEGEFIIKGYYGYDINTLIGKQLGLNKNSINTYKRGVEYNLYNPQTDWYFLNIYESDKPTLINDTTAPPQTIGNLTVSSIFTISGQTNYIVGGLSDPLVSYNGSVLFKNVEYSAITSGSTTEIKLNFIPEDGQVLTYAYVTNGQSNDFFGDTFKIDNSIISGTSKNYEEKDRVFFNTETEKYEFYLISPPFGIPVLILNGSVLAFEVDYLLSTSNLKRVIFTKPLTKGDLIEAFYTPKASVIGTIPNNKPLITWSVSNFPLNTNGKFIVEFADEKDDKFVNILHSFETPYVLNQRNYSLETFLDGTSAGDRFLYRIKNEKFYQPIIGETVYSFSFSDIIKIEIGTNIGENY